MRRRQVWLAVLACTVLAASSWRALRAEEDAPAAPRGPAEQDEGRRDAALSAEERQAALARASELNAQLVDLYRQGRYGDAIPVAREALALRERVLGPDHPDVATSVNNLALLLQAQGDLVEARPLLERALEASEKVLGPNHLDVATSLNNLASVLQALGSYEAARPLFERALAIREKALGPAHHVVAQSLNNLGALLQAQGAYEKAGPLLDRALAIFEAVLGPDHLVVATCLNNLALLRMEQGTHEGALPLFERSLAIREAVLGPDHPDVATALGNLALLRIEQGAYEAARPLLERGLGIVKQALGPDHPDVATNLNSLAELLRAQGSLAAARPLYERALVIRREALGPDHPDVALSMNNLAELLRLQGEYEAAAPLLEQAMEIREKALGPDHPLVAHSLNNLAGLAQARGEYEVARPLFERALEIKERALGPDHPDVARGLNNLAGLLQAQGAHGAARALFERALGIREAAWGPDHPDVADGVHNLGLLLQSVGQLERASPLYERALSILEKNVRRQLTGLQTPERLALAQSSHRQLDDWLALAPRLGRTGYPEVLRFRGLVARASAAERRLARRGGWEAAARVEDLLAAERRLARLANHMPPMFRKERHRAWQEAYAKAGADRDRLARELARDFAPLRQGLERMDLRMHDVQAHLGPDAALLDFLRSGDRYLAWILRREGEAVRVDLGDARTIDAQALAFTQAAATLPGTAEARGRLLPAPQAGGPLDPGEALRALVFEPLAEQLPEGVRTLYLCPDAALAAVPFTCLPGKEEGHYLIDDYLLVQVSMAQDLVPWPDEEVGEGALLVGGVDYGTASEGEELPTEATPRIPVLDRAPRGRSFAPLPQTAQEVEFVRGRLAEDCISLAGPGATEARLRTEVHGKRTLHIATHGFVRDDLMHGLSRREGDDRWLGADMERQLAAGYDPMLMAGLAFAGANPREGGHGDDGILTAAEASYLDLDGVDLVVLSACETALGKAESGEGVIGLVQGFQMAGAKRVIASLWQVDDEATRLLMQHLYDGMLREEDPLSPAEALREAARTVRSATGTGGRSFAAPRYWASFLCYGR